MKALYISIHSPRMGRDVHPARPGAWHYQFQSTLPAWGETIVKDDALSIHQYFNPLSPHGERQWLPGSR